MTLTSIRFQASAFSQVDDLLVTGQTADGESRRLSIGVRRAPLLVKSDEPSIDLLAAYLRVVVDHWDEIQSGRWRLGLAVASPNQAVKQLRELSVIAAGQPDGRAFRADVGRPRRTNLGVRDRLIHLDAMVTDGVRSFSVDRSLDPRELTWRLLSALHVNEMRLEGVDQTDRTMAVASLRGQTREGTPSAADALFSRLVELVGGYAPAGAEVTDALLRQALSGIPLARSSSFKHAWDFLDGLAQRLHSRTGFSLADAETHLEFERADARQAVSGEMRAAASRSTIVVVGEPDVGKSALVLRAADELSAGGLAITALSLRDLPSTTLEFESVLDAALVDVLAGAATGLGRLLVIDGAEAALEGRGPLLTDLATAALRAGLGVAAVTRRDGARAVAEALRHAGEAAGTGPPREHDVHGLTSSETAAVGATFPSLARLADDPRSARLLSRPGLTDLLLRAGADFDREGSSLSEAEVFAIVWQRLVRRGESSSPGGPSPDARARALTSLARQLLLPGEAGDPPDANALPSLRSDGLLLPPGLTSAWNPKDEFSTDLARDLALTRLLITDGWEILDQAGAPRWALRAVRVACQAVMARAGADAESARIQLQDAFGDLAKRHGDRWTELPLEALLTLGGDGLAQAWPALLEGDRSGIETLVRLGLHRYSRQGFGDPSVLGPLVDLAYCGAEDLGQHDRYGPGEQIRELVLAWLRGLVQADGDPVELRQRVRDRVLEREPEAYDEFAVEALAMLGPDLDESAERFLRGLADNSPGHLAPAVESIGPMLAMSVHQPELLLALAEAFYIEDDDADGGWGGFLEDGIRHHRRTGFGMPGAAWYFGPFFRLLNARPAETLAFVNRMLDHAAAARVRELSRYQDDEAELDTEPFGLDLDLPSVGVMRCVGDGHVWSWYRGSSVGPYPCMSALLAVERFADHLVDVFGLPLATVTEWLLRDCHNLAMPGLVVGLLVRHLEQSGDLLDRWLVRPEVWHLEFSRRTSEGVLHVQGRDDRDLVGEERRRYTFRDVAAELTLKAMLAGEEARLSDLATVGEDLLRRARELGIEEQDAEEMASIEGWAALFRPENYQPHDGENGTVVIQYEPPEEVTSALAPSLASLTRGNEAMRLQVTYARSEDRVAPIDTLIEDLSVARDLAEDPTPHGPLDPADPAAAVAAAAVLAHADGRSAVPQQHLRWAADVLLDVATHPTTDEMSFSGSIYPMGADRSAAVAVPALILPIFDSLGLDREQIGQALARSSTSVFDEVRAAFALGVSRVWEVSCDDLLAAERCRHGIAWSAVERGIRDSRLGGWNPTAQRRLPDPLDPPYVTTLPTVETENLLVNRLTHPLVAAARAARSQTCIRERARLLLHVLYDAHRRGSDHWARKGYRDFGDRDQRRVVRVLVEEAAIGNMSPLTDYVRAFGSNARALAELFHDLAIVFTYEDTLRGSLPLAWREAMTTALDSIGPDLLQDHHWPDGAVKHVLPVPQVDVADTNPDATLERARASWLHPDEIADLVLRWIPIARGRPGAIDELVRLVRCASPQWQASTGLAWVEDLVGDSHQLIAGRCWFLGDWLEEIRATSQIDFETTSKWRRLVDRLATEGDSRAIRLQQIEE